MVFYAVALVSIIVNVILAWTEYKCNGVNFFLHLCLTYLTLIVGNYIGCQIKILRLQLQELIASRDEILMVQDPDSTTLSERIAKLNKGKKVAYAFFAVSLAVLTAICLADYFYTRDVGPDACSSDGRKHVILVHKIFQLLPCCITIVCICVPSCRLKKILKSKVDDTSSFKMEMRKIHCTNLAFILSILFLTLAYVVVVIFAASNLY